MARNEPATLRGFHVPVADIGDGMHLCQPLLSFHDDSVVYVANRLDWRDDPDALAIADRNEAAELGTLLPPERRRSITSGQGVIAIGESLVLAAKAAGTDLLHSEVPFVQVDDTPNGRENRSCAVACWIGVAKPSVYTALKARLTEEALEAFDSELGDAALRGSQLSGRGNAALRLITNCGPRRRDDLAIRELAAAIQNETFDLYRRLLIRFRLELRTPEDTLHERAMRHIELAQDAKAENIDHLARIMAAILCVNFGSKLAEAALQSKDFDIWHPPKGSHLWLGTPEKLIRARTGRYVALGSGSSLQSMHDFPRHDASALFRSSASPAQKCPRPAIVPLSLPELSLSRSRAGEIGYAPEKCLKRGDSHGVHLGINAG